MSLVTLSKTVESPKGLPAIADVAKPVQAAEIEIGKEGRAARVKKATAEPSALESELHSATHIPIGLGAQLAWDPHWRKRTENAQQNGRDVVSSDFGFLGKQYRWGEDCAVSLYGGPHLWRGVCISHEQSSQ